MIELYDVRFAERPEICLIDDPGRDWDNPTVNIGGFHVQTDGCY